MAPHEGRVLEMIFRTRRRSRYAQVVFKARRRRFLLIARVRCIGQQHCSPQQW